MKYNESKHTFAINVTSDLAKAISNNRLELSDAAIRNRVTTVLRLKSNEPLIVFDHSIWIRILIDQKTFEQKKAIIGTVIEKVEHKKLASNITLAVGLTKKEAFEEVAYFATQMGASCLIPLITEKTHRKWGGEKELVRLQNIMIAAAEQSKQFVIPKIETPLLFQAFLKKISKEDNFYFDTHGKSLLSILQDLAPRRNNKITLIFGPEGGLSPEEVKALDKTSCQCISLTSSILRTQEAVAVGLGSISSVINNKLIS